MTIRSIPSSFHLRTRWSESGVSFELKEREKVQIDALLGGAGGAAAEMTRNLLMTKDFEGSVSRKVAAAREEEARRRGLDDAAASAEAKAFADDAARREALNKTLEQRDKDLDTLITHVDLSFEDQMAFMDKDRRASGAGAASADSRAVSEFNRDFAAKSHCAFTKADIGKRVIIEGDHVTVAGTHRPVTWELATKHVDLSGVIADVQEYVRGLVLLKDGRSFQNPSPAAKPKLDDAAKAEAKRRKSDWGGKAAQGNKAGSKAMDEAGAALRRR